MRDDPAVDFMVRELRLPTALAGLAVGVALGVAGLVFQRLLANPLASPDFVGVSAGASLFAVAAIVLFDLGSAGISLAALIGALVGDVWSTCWPGATASRATASSSSGSASPSSCSARRLRRRPGGAVRRRAAMTWLIGAVGYAGPGQLRVLLIALAVLVPVALVLERALRTLELGDDAARALGARVERPAGAARLAIVLVGSPPRRPGRSCSSR